MLSLGQSCSWSLRWDENRGISGLGETPGFAAEAEMAQGLFPGSDRHRRRVGDPWWPPGPGAAGLGGCCQNHGSPEGNSQGTVLVSALPAFLLLPEPGCTPAPEPGATLAGLRLSVSHPVPFARLWSLSLQDGTHPGNRG